MVLPWRFVLIWRNSDDGACSPHRSKQCYRAAFRSLGALPLEAIGKGAIIGVSLVAGSFLAKHFVHRLDADRFRLLMDALLLIAGATMLWAAVG